MTDALPRLPIFLHAAWLGRGEWLWSGLRHDPAACGFLEPLHEGLAGVARADLAAPPPGPGEARQAAREAPAWQEFAPLLGSGGGMAGFLPRFAWRDAFATPGEDPALIAWIGRLLAVAHGSGRVAVVLSCRSAGRARLLHAAFPEALHLLVLRRPDALWAAASRLARQEGNRRFLVLPLLMLAANARAAPVRAATAALGLTPPPLLARTPQAALAEAGEAFARLSEAVRYRAFLAWWLATTLAGLRGGARPLDADMLAWSAPARQALTETIAAASGLALHLTIPAETQTPPPLDEDQAAAQSDALGLLEEKRAVLPPAGYLLAWNLLAAALVRPLGHGAGHGAVGCPGGTAIPGWLSGSVWPTAARGGGVSGRG